MNALSLIKATVEPTHAKLDSIQFYVVENPDDLSNSTARSLAVKINKILKKHGFEFNEEATEWVNYDNGDFYQVGDGVVLPDPSKALAAGRKLKVVFEDAGFQDEMNFDPQAWVRVLYKRGAKKVVATVEPQEMPGVYDAYNGLVDALVKRQGGHTTNKSAMLVVPGKAGLAARVHGFQHNDTYRVYVTVFAPSLQEETWDIGEEDFQIDLEGHQQGAVGLKLSRTWSRKTSRITMNDGELVGRLQADCATLVKKLEAEFAPNFWKLRYFMPREGNKLVSLAVVNKVRAEQAAARRMIDNA